MPLQKRLTIAVMAMAVIVTAAAVHYGSRSAGGADSYGYVSQAEGWLAGDVLQHQRFLEAQHDRPVTRWIFTPLGWKPSKTTSDLVPFYAPGYPMLLAGFKALFGHAAMFWVVPLLAGVLVWSTFFLGCRLEQPGPGAVAALIVASSATVLYMSMAPMSDVPSAALWTLTLACGLGRTRASALGAGLVAAIAILVRPNLLPLGVFLGMWLLWNDVRLHRARFWRARALPYALAAAGGVLWIAVLNNRWYGDTAESGYGNLGGFFALAHVGPNLVRYASWLFSAETPLALVGLGVMLFAPAFVNRRRDVVGVPVLLFAWVAWVWGMYLLYLVFDAWWFLRFVLPVFPLMAIGSAALAAWLWRRGALWRAAVAVTLVASMSANVWFAWRHHAFRIGLTESRYPQVARAVASMTDPQSAIITLQHSGSVRYYGGRMTVRWDVILHREFGTLVSWLRANGHHPYLLIDGGEVADVRQRFGNDPAFAPALWPPMASFFNNETMLFDLDATGPTIPTVLGAYTHRAIEPALPPRWER